MYLSKEAKSELFAKHGHSAADTGSVEGQVALFTTRIAHLTEHLKKNKKDFSTQLSLQKLVGKRRGLLAYLFHKDIERYRAIIKALQLRDIIK
jgi:small subunit ribosomal protein S15